MPIIPGMAWICLALFVVAFAVALPVTEVMRRLGHRLRALDGAGVAGQVKAAPRRVPNTGGVGIFVGFLLPLAVGLLAVNLLGPSDLVRMLGPLGEYVAPHIDGLRSESRLGALVLGSILVLHVLGLIDDRKPLGPFFKLAILTLPAVVVTTFSDTRLLTLVDAKVGGAWLSIIITTLWFVVVTNAMNFLDNMDGLAGGVGAVAAGFFLWIALLHQQWFVGASLALLLGALAGFLVLNRPPARIFMGDGGSLVVGFLLAFLSTRITYFSARGEGSAAWYAVLTPLAVLAVPLYDFTSVVLIRLSQGKSPFVGDLQHTSHRLVMRGLSKGMAVLVICGFATSAGLAGVVLAEATVRQAMVVGAQVVTLLAIIAIFEYASAEKATGAPT